MSDKVYLNKISCRKYVEHEKQLSRLAAKDEKILPILASSHLPEKDKVHVAIGCGGGRDFEESVLGKDSKVVRRIGVDYSPHMIEHCKTKHPDAEVLKDDMRSLKKLRKYLKNETRPVIYTLLTNTLGNVESVDRSRTLKAIRDCMKNEDLFISELYIHPIETAQDPNLIPESFMKTKVRFIDPVKKELGTAIPLYKLFPYSLAVKNPELSWVLHAYEQQEYYAEMDFIREVVGRNIHTSFNAETNNIEVYRARDRKSVFLRKILREATRRKEKFDDYFELVVISHRWTGLEIAKEFTDAGFVGELYAGKTMYIPKMMRYCDNKGQSEKNSIKD